MSRQEAGKKFAEKMKAIDPDYFKKLGKKGVIKNPYRHFAHLKENDPEKLQEMGRHMGRSNKGRRKIS